MTTSANLTRASSGSEKRATAFSPKLPETFIHCVCLAVLVRQASIVSMYHHAWGALSGEHIGAAPDCLGTFGDVACSNVRCFATAALVLDSANTARNITNAALQFPEIRRTERIRQGHSL
jgi:hypothetical protein